VKKLTCKVCEFQAFNLEPHINKVHSDKGGIAWYVAEFECDEFDIVARELVESGEKVPTGKVRVGSVDMPTGLGGEHVPKATPHYYFAPHTDNVCKDILEKKAVMLIGHTGTGKTSLITQIAARLNQPLLRVNMNGQTSVGDFVGLWTVKGGETVWVDGVLPLAMRMGYWLIVDEVSVAEAPNLSVLQSVLESSDGTLTLKEKGHEVIVPHENFRIFSTDNAAGSMSRFRHLYQGTNILNEAFLDRWRVYKIGYLPAAEEAKVLAASIPTSEKAAQVLVRVANALRDGFEREELAQTFSLRRLIDWGQMIVRTKNALEAAECTIFSKVSKEDAEVIKGVISNIIPTRK